MAFGVGAMRSATCLQQRQQAATCYKRTPCSSIRHSRARSRAHAYQCCNHNIGKRKRNAVAVQAILRGTTSNPAFQYGQLDEALVSSPNGWGSSTSMTVGGTVNKAGLLMAMSIATAAATWMQIFSGNAAAVMATLGAAKACGMVGMLAVVVSMFKPTLAPYTAPTYAICKGVALAAMSAVLEMSYPGIAMNAVLVTFSTAASLLIALKARIIQVTDRFADTVRAVTGGYFVAILLVFLGSLVGLKLPGLFSGGPLGIGISLVAAGLAAANLLLDMDWIEKASYQRLPKWMEWYGAQSLMLTLVWMYTEILRLLWMLAGNRDD